MTMELLKHQFVDEDEFTFGMQILAVDHDDRTCLNILEKLFLRCLYDVTNAQNTITALNLLRENKNKFDLIICNVHDQDMDEFKLLELAGLEMNLPVIVCSGNDDPKIVMKGITHGACDKLLKPVGMKTSQTDNHDTPNSDCGKIFDSAVTANLDQNEKPSRKRKDPNEDVSVANEDDHDNEVLTVRKKPRVTWTDDLHRKFVAAVNHLGFDKAVPKKILALMNVEKLTKENVASHLQKYRLSLKRKSCVENQQTHMVEASGRSAFGSHSGVGGQSQTLNDTTQNDPFRSSLSSAMGSRFNIPTNLNLHGLHSSGNLQLNQTHNSKKSIYDELELISALIRSNANDVGRMPIYTGLDQLQHHRDRGIISPIQNMTNKPEITRSFTPSSILDISNYQMMLEANPQNKNLVSQHSQFYHPRVLTFAGEIERF